MDVMKKRQTEMLFPTGPLRKQAIEDRLRKLGVRNPEPLRGRKLLSVFDRETRDIITGALKEAETYTSQAAIELVECGEYDEADSAADLMEAIQKLRVRISHLQLDEDEEGED